MVLIVTFWMGAILKFSFATIYTNDWAIKINGDVNSVDRIAEKYGFSNLGQIGDLKGYYSFCHQETANRSSVSNKEVTADIAREEQVEWLQQQVVNKRVSRSSNDRRIYRAGAETKRFAAPLHFSDPEWSHSWYIRCTENSDGCQAQRSIAGAWQMGYTGKGVVVSVLDDGIERDHPDLEPNYDPLASDDVREQDRDPSPSHSNNAANYHGTQCAKVIAAAAAANISKCPMGVAYHARIGGVRMLGGDVTDIVEAHSLSFRPQHIDIYLAGWGPEDDGATVGGPGVLGRLALQAGAQRGRDGRGSIFVWASGNGGGAGDYCSCDGYTNSIYTISISGAGRHGHQPSYVERCPSTLAAVYGGDEMVTPGSQQSCGASLSGTSLSSSVAAGILALTLEANPLLTWRDVQHIIVRTSKADPLIAPDWHRNGAGYKVSHLYGFGLLDAERMVKEAERWRYVPPQHECTEDAAIQLSRVIHPGSTVISSYDTKGCSGEAQQHVAHVEHVVVRASLRHRHRGDLSVTLTSPSGTVSQLLANRPLDNSTEGFQDWEFMTIHCWGEPAAGVWTLKIKDTPSHNRDGVKPGALEKWSLVIYGTSEQPYSTHHLQVRSAEIPTDSDSTEDYNGPCDPQCSEDGCEGPGPQQCVTCLHSFLKFKNNTRLCVSECPAGFWADRRRCKRCYSSCLSCTGSRSDQCTSCQPGFHLTEGASTCTTTCGDNYYLDHDTNICRSCSENCLKCTSQSICTECKEDTSLQGNRCQQSCAPGFYHDPQEGACRPCHQACATCAGAGLEACSHCAEGFFAEEWRCVSSCSPGFYALEPSPEKADGQRLCRRCDASCLTCGGPGPKDCSSCSRGHSLQEGACVINTACTDGEFQDSDGVCHACDATCLKCRGPRSQDCISCPPSRTLDEGRCVAACAQGKYQSGGQCHLCDHTCATCVDAKPSSCTTCDKDKFGVERYLHRGQCLDACPEAFYHTAERTCQPCSPNCQLCTNPNRCLMCNSSYYVSNGRCVKLECGEGEVEDPDYDECMACEEGCKTCVLYNPRHCLSCIEGFYNFQDGCYRNCPAKTYSVQEEMTCVPCDDNCVSCDEHECYWCETDLFLSDGNCVSVCPDGFFGEDDSGECEECHLDCETCVGPEEDDCDSCQEGKKLQNGQCVPDDDVCPIKTFHSDDGACEDCHPSCESCVGHEKNQCSKCGKGRFLTAQQTCVSKCPTGFFAGRLSGVCEECPPGCLQCVDAQHCSRCLNSRRAQLLLQDGKCVQECVRGYPVGQLCHSCAPGCASCERNATHCLACEEPLLLHKHQCLERCPEGHTAQDRECHQCPPACQECTTLGQCTDCEDDHFVHEGTCVSSCPERFFEDTVRVECLPCHPDCALCYGPRGSECAACLDPEATLHSGACLAACPSNTYRDAAAAKCKECDDSCLTCSGPDMNSCTSCTDDQKLDGHGRCVPILSKCSPHQYEDQEGLCHFCHKYCHQCSGPGRSHCLSCTQRHLLLNGTCVAECPAGYYEEESGQACEPCHASCHSCVGKHSHQCLTCKAHLFREAKECVETCQHGHYGNAVSRTCEQCDPSCSECARGGEDGCLSCAPGLLYLRKEGRCLPTCPDGNHYDPVQQSCEPCHGSCRTCSGSVESCNSCFPGYELSDDRCESLCDPDQYPLVKGLHYSCEDCDSSCSECRGPGPFNCSACPVQAILEAGGRCLLCCQREEEQEEEEEEEQKGDAVTAEQDCCNCTETRGECVLTTKLPFRNEDVRGNLTVFIIASILLVLALVGVVLIIRHSRSKGKQSDLPPRGYEKLGSGRGFGGGYSSASTASYGGPASSSGGRFQDQLVDMGRSGSRDDDDDEDDEDDEDIVYMGKDGTVYRKFRYGQLGEDNEDELEYDDESYTYR